MGAPNELGRTVIERYASAQNSTNLTVKAGRRTDADVLIAAGWSKDHLGLLLWRLKAEWDSVDKPRPVRGLALRALAESVRRHNDASFSSMGEARAIADAWHRQELVKLAGKLKSLGAAREAVMAWAEAHKIGRQVALDCLHWWLDSTCGTCDGTKFQPVPGTRRLSNKHCPACRGSGQRHIPHGNDGRWMLEAMDRATASVAAGLAQRLKASMDFLEGV